MLKNSMLIIMVMLMSPIVACLAFLIVTLALVGIAMFFAISYIYVGVDSVLEKINEWRAK